MKKRLYKSKTAKMIDGVCGGIGHYFDVDPTIIRLAWVLVTCVSAGWGIVGYIAAIFIIPTEPDYIDAAE